MGPGGSAGGFLGGTPPDNAVKAPSRNSGPLTPMVRWAKNVNGTLKRERQMVTDQMKRNTAVANGDTPWWSSSRDSWKIGTVLRYAATVPLSWTAILCDAQPTLNYTALDRSKQKRADIATAAWSQAYDAGNWAQKIHNAVLVSRVQKKAYLRLTYDSLAHGGRGRPKLTVVLGEQVYMDRNATCVDDSEVLLYEYRESYGSLSARFKDINKKLSRKYYQPQNPDGQGNDVLTPPGSYNLNDVRPGSGTVYTPAYSASSNPPDSAAGSSGILVREYWTRPHKTIEVDEVQFLTSGEPATEPKMYECIDEADEEPMRRITVEGGVIYELPESLVNALYDYEEIKILEDQPALQCLMHKVKYPLYPDGRLVTIVDEDIEADDRMNPLGYTPFAEIIANSALDGTQYGPSDIDLIYDPLEQLIRLVCLVHDTANLTGNPIERYPIGGEISNDDITNAPGGIRREDIMSLRYGKREPGVELPQYIIPHIKWLVEQIKDQSGLTDVMLGKMPPKTQVSTETMTMGQEASGVRFRDALASLSSCIRTLGEHYLELMARFYTAPVMVQIKNDAGVMEATPMLGAYLTDPFVVEAKAGSKQTSGPSARLNTLMAMKNAGIPFALQTVYDLLEELGSIPSASAAMREVETLKNQGPTQAWKLIGLPSPDNKKQTKTPGSRRSKKSGQG